MNKNLKAGIFVILGIVVLFLFYFWSIHFQLKRSGYVVSVHFPDVTGLKRKDPVRVYGVEKGTVKKIAFYKDYVEVIIRMDEDVVLYDDAHAYIKDVAMISGTKYVELDPGKSGNKFDIKQPIPGDPSLGIPLSMIGDIGESISKLLVPLQQGDMLVSITSLIKNLNQISRDLSVITSKNRESIGRTIKNIERDTEELKKTLQKVNRVSSVADTLLQNIKDGKGTLGKLANSDSVYIEIQKTLKSIRELVEDIKAHPKRYLKLF